MLLTTPGFVDLEHAVLAVVVPEVVRAILPAIEYDLMPAPKTQPTGWEAMASELNPRGAPYSCGELLLPPGEWVEITERQSMRLALMPWAKIRQRKGEG